MASGWIMNGMVSHAFAAVMTATVVMFPTPHDLWETMTRAPVTPDQARVLQAGIERSFPVIVSEDLSITEINQGLDYCAANFSRLLPVHIQECQELLEVAALVIGDGPSSPESKAADRRLTLAMSHLCRHQWASANSTERTFDVVECKAGIAPLAESH